MKSTTNRKHNEFRVRPWNELHFNPIYNDNDPLQQRPFLASVNMNKDQYDYNNNIQLTRTSSNGRNKHYKYNGSPAEAITAALEAEGRL